jgi:hypothetical protein
MKTPTKEPRNEPSLEKYTYYDHTTVVQEDGRIAKFTWNNKERDKGWQFSHWEDAHGFMLLEDTDLRHAHLLIDSEVTLGSHCDEEVRRLKRDFALADNEELHEYSYGGFLSGRGGLYVTPKDSPGKVLRSKGVWMS